MVVIHCWLVVIRICGLEEENLKVHQEQNKVKLAQSKPTRTTTPQVHQWNPRSRELSNFVSPVRGVFPRTGFRLSAFLCSASTQTEKVPNFQKVGRTSFRMMDREGVAGLRKGFAVARFDDLLFDTHFPACTHREIDKVNEQEMRKQFAELSFQNFFLFVETTRFSIQVGRTAQRWTLFENGWKQCFRDGKTGGTQYFCDRKTGGTSSNCSLWEPDRKCSSVGFWFRNVFYSKTQCL